jgi:hypothetical protein
MQIDRQAARAYILETVSEARRDWPFYAVIFAYALVVLSATLINGVGEIFLPFLYLQKWLRPIYLLVAGFLTVVGIASLREEAPLRAFITKIHRILPPARAASVLMFLGLAAFHGIFTSLKNLINLVVDFQFDRQLADLDALLHFGDPWTILPHWEPFTRLLQVQYSLVWVTLLAAMSFYVVLYCTRTLRTQYIWTFLICWIILGNVVAIQTMSAGPVYYAQVLGSGRFEPLMDYLSFSQHTAYSSVDLQNRLWVSYDSGVVDIGSGISAFPSLHLAMTSLWALVAYEVNKWFGRLMVLFAVLILIGSVHLGWHYAIDGYVSILATVAIWKLVGHFQRRRHPIQPMIPAFNHALGNQSAREPS